MQDYTRRSKTRWLFSAKDSVYILNLFDGYWIDPSNACVLLECFRVAYMPYLAYKRKPELYCMNEELLKPSLSTEPWWVELTMLWDNCTHLNQGRECTCHSQHVFLSIREKKKCFVFKKQGCFDDWERVPQWHNYQSNKRDQMRLKE